MLDTDPTQEQEQEEDQSDAEGVSVPGTEGQDKGTSSRVPPVPLHFTTEAGELSGTPYRLSELDPQSPAQNRGRI